MSARVCYALCALIVASAVAILIAAWMAGVRP